MTKRFLKTCCFYNALDFLVAVFSSWILLLACLGSTNWLIPNLFDQKLNTPELAKHIEQPDLTFMTNQCVSVTSTQRLEQTDSPFVTNKHESAALNIVATTNLPPSGGKNEMLKADKSPTLLKETVEKLFVPLAILICNYFLVLFCNPKRWFLAALLLPKRILLCTVAVILNLIGFVFLVFSFGAKDQLGESARIAKDMRYKKTTRDKHRSDAIGFMIFTSIAKALSSFSFSINKNVLANMRSKNRQYTLLDDTKDVVQNNMVNNLEEKRMEQPTFTPKQADVIAHTDVKEVDSHSNRGACISNTDLRIENDSSPLNIKVITDKYPQELLFFIISIASIIASKFISPMVCALVVVLFALVHLITRGRVIIVDGIIKQRKLLMPLLKLLVFMPLADIIVTFIILKIIL
jgi:hypothetical protein